MAIAIHASTPAAAAGGASGTSPTLTSNSFSPPANSLIVVFNQYCSNGANVTSVSDSLASHLTYVQLIASATTNAYADIWVADVGAAPGSMTVTSTMSATVSNTSMGIEILVLTGAAVAASQTGQTATATGVAGAATATLASAAASSWIFGSLGYKVSTAPTIPGGQTDSFNSLTQLWSSSTSKEGFVQGNTAPGNSNLTINDTAPTGTWGIAVAEIIAGAGSSSFSRPISDSLDLTGSLAATSQHPRALTATVHLSESFAGQAGKTRLLTDTARLAQSLARTAHDARTLTGSLTLANSLPQPSAPRIAYPTAAALAGKQTSAIVTTLSGRLITTAALATKTMTAALAVNQTGASLATKQTSGALAARQMTAALAAKQTSAAIAE